MAKICFLTSTINYGGATKILIEIANYLSDYHNVSIMYYGNDEVSFYKIKEKIDINKVPVTSCNIRKVRLLTQMKIIRSELRSLNPDLVIAFGNTEKLMAIGGSIGTKIKVVISERQDPYNYNPGKKTTMWLRYMLADGCVFQTKGAAKYFPKRIQRKSTVIPNFIFQEKRDFVSIEKKEKIVSFSARFELKQKRQDIMVEAFYLVSKKYPDWKLVFYGDGDDQLKIEEIVKSKGLNNQVVFEGKVSNVLDYIYKSAIFVLSSDYEGIPNALLEAMGLGIPCVSTDCSPGGARLLIKNYHNGLLVPINDPKALADAIIYFIKNPVEADAMGKKAMNVLDIYKPEKIMHLWNDYICKYIVEDK
ncbi:glycosyltransferase [Ruminococcus flavefaciens]|uniref:glycosyltransferase n=1 Tax=Ruminococcus flavefaciens TaxID=1265 RepID=UPI0003118D42|nr:glycosyltransferase [Ruminococcus flavefaciens]